MPSKKQVTVTDSLYTSVAKKILTESLKVKKGESITVESWNSGLDFARQVMIEARKIGCIPILLFEDEKAYVGGVRNAPPDSLGQMGKHEMGLLSSTDAYVFIPGSPIGTYSKAITAEQKSKSTAYNSSWYEAAEKARLRGVRMSFGYVGEEYSKLLGKSVGEMVKHQLNAALVDFQEIGRKGRDIATCLQDEREAAITTGDTRLAFKLKGDISVEDGVVDEDDIANGENMCYMPPGFVSKQVDPSSATGKVRISPSLTRLGLVPESVLEFKEGRLVGYESKSAQAKRALKEIIEATPENSRNLSLFTI